MYSMGKSIFQVEIELPAILKGPIFLTLALQILGILLWFQLELVM
jgi:hypothetical protein